MNKKTLAKKSKQQAQQAKKTVQKGAKKTKKALKQAKRTLTTDRRPYEKRTREELLARAAELNIEGRSSMSKAELILALRRKQ